MNPEVGLVVATACFFFDGLVVGWMLRGVVADAGGILKAWRKWRAQTESHS